MKKHLWVDTASRDEQGSFCDAGSGTHYDNVDRFTAEVAVRQAESQGREIRALSDATDEDSITQRFNLYYSEHDDQGTDAAAKHRVGGL